MGGEIDNVQEERDTAESEPKALPKAKEETSDQ